MKVKDTAMGKWFNSLPDDHTRVSYIMNSLYTTSGGTFWNIVERYALKAQSPYELAELVLDYLMEYDPDEPTPEELESDRKLLEEEQQGRDAETVRGLNRGDL